MKFAYQWHRRIGWVLAPLLAISACSGIVLLWMQPLPEAPEASPAPVQAWAQSIDAGLKTLASLHAQSEPDMVDLPRAPGAPIRVHLRDAGWAEIDPANGAAGAVQPDSRDARTIVLALHEHLLLDDVGPWVLRAVALCALVLIGMGLRIWWRVRKLPARSVWRKWHRRIGPVAVLPIALMLTTGFVLRSPEFARAVLPGEVVGAKIEPLAGNEARSVSIGDALTAAAAALPQARPVRIYALRDGVLRVRLRAEEWNPYGLHYVHLRATDGSVLRVVKASDQPPAVRYLDVVYPLHAGWVPGNAGVAAAFAWRALWTLIALSLAAMAVSGGVQRFHAK